MVVTQRAVDDGLKDYNRWILQLLDLLLLKREVNKFISQTVIQRARIEAIIRECSGTSISPKDSSCEKLVSSLDVSDVFVKKIFPDCKCGCVSPCLCFPSGYQYAEENREHCQIDAVE